MKIYFLSLITLPVQTQKKQNALTKFVKAFNALVARTGIEPVFPP